MKTMHLFAGAGGGLLCDLILGHEPIVAVEWDKNCCATLRRKSAEWLPGLHVHEGDVRLFDPSEYAGRVDSIHAGFPCQDISAAGKGEGITGARSGLVSEVFRAIDAIRPKFVFLENSPRIRTRGRHVVIGELVARGYAWRDGIVSAADVGAMHQRDRWWCLAASADGLRQLEQEGGISNEWRRVDNCAKEVADIVRARCSNSGGITTAETQTNIGRSTHVAFGERTGTREKAWFEAEPDVGRLVYGMADGLVPGSVKALGNGQVPLQAALAYVLLGGLAAQAEGV